LARLAGFRLSQNGCSAAQCRGLRTWEAAAKGDVHFDPSRVLPAVKAFEQIPDAEYREMLRPVAEAG